MLLDREQHVLEAAEHVRADRFEFEQAGKADHRQLVDRDREMVGPEMHQPLDERAGRWSAPTMSRAPFITR